MSDTFEHQPARWIDPANGRLIPHDALMTRMAAQRVVLLGETHDQYDIHRWQLAVITGLHAMGRDLVVGFEMFPRSAQPVLDQWVAGSLSPGAFLEKADWKTCWGFPPDLYFPLFHFCREFRVPMRALNCYRALVTRVGKEGWDAIPEEERDGLTPARPAEPAYRDYLFDLVGDFNAAVREESPEREARRNRFVRAQQTWDRAFACNIAAALEDNARTLVVGIIGRGHLEYGHGTPCQLADLGIDKVSILLPSREAAPRKDSLNGLCDALFRLPDRIEDDC
jgi:uncharacterized iron-regulated protein